MRYGFSRENAKASGGVLGRVQLSPAEIEFVWKGCGQNHPDHVEIVRLLRYGVTASQAFWDLSAQKTHTQM